MGNYKIGSVALKSRAVLAPMAGVSDRAYRELCMKFGAGLCINEFSPEGAIIEGDILCLELENA